MKLLVLDGNSIVNRAFYGIKLLTTKDGRYTNAIYGFMNILLNLMKDVQPDEVAIAFDLKAPTFRHKMYDGYKATRKGMPEELAQQMPVLKQLLADLGFVMVSKEGYEADDILGTLSAAAAQRGDDCFIATGDRDSLQLVSDHVTVLLASTRMGRSETVVMDKAAVEEKYGVSPKQLIEVKSLMGDTSDNIPGVAGVGEKTALSLIQTFGSLEGVYANLENTAIKPGVRTKLTADRENALLSHKLAAIDCNIPVDTTPGTYKRTEGDPAAAAALLAELEIHSLVSRLGLEAEAAPSQEQEAALDTVQPEPLPLAVEGKFYLANQQEHWYAVQNQSVYLLDEPSLVRLLESSAELWVFDAKSLYHIALAHDGVGRAIVFDAKLAAYLLNPAASSYAVDNLAAEYGIAAQFLCPEAPQASQLEGLYQALANQIKAEEMEDLLSQIELPLALVLADMERTGMLVDKEGLQAFGDQLKAELQNCLDRIYEGVGYEFNLNSPKQLGEALFDKMGLPPRKKTKSGYSTDAETLESLRAYSPVVEDILQYRTYQKLNSTYVEGLLKVIGEDGRMHSTFNQTEARTGRLSSSEPNMQNIPIRTPLGSQLRKFFVAKPGCTLLDADYSQIELRLLAHISGDESMQHAFLNGQDIHRSTAAKIYNLPPEMITPALRSSAKAVNFGIVYGIGAFSLSRDINVTVKEADEFIKNYLATFPGVKQYMDDTIAHGKEKGYVTTLFGRRRALPELSSKNFNLRSLGERMAMNTPIQGTAADIIKLAMVKVWWRLRQEGLTAKLILQVHDELIVEAPESEIEAASRILKEEMEGAVQYSVPLTADVNQGKSWFESH